MEALSSIERRELQLNLAKELKAQPSRIVTTRLEDATKYELSMTLRYFSLFRRFEYKENKKGLIRKKYFKDNYKEYVVIDKGENGDRNDIVQRSDSKKLAEELERKFPYWKNPQMLKDAVLELAYRLLDSNYFNSEKNPIFKHPDASETTAADYIAFIEFDSGDVQFQVRLANVSIEVNKDNTITADTKSFTNYVIDIKKEGGTSIRRNGRLFLGAAEVMKFYDNVFKNVFFEDIETRHPDTIWFADKIKDHLFTNDFGNFDIVKWNYINKTFVGYYNILHHQVLTDLPWKLTRLYSLYDPDLTSKERRAQLKVVIKHLRAGDTKAATDACFYGVKLPRAIRSFFIANSYPLYLTSNDYRLVKQCCDAYGVNKTLDLLGANRGVLNLRIFEYSFMLEAMLLGFSYDEFNKFFTSDSRDFNSFKTQVFDTVRMYNELKDAGIDIDISVKKISKFHDVITPAYNALCASKNSAEAIAFRTVATDTDVKPFKYDEYVIRAPKNAFELISVGNNMHHCVASYTEDYFYKCVDISLVVRKDDGSYVACIEHKDGFVLQAKLHHNKQVKTKPQVLEAVNEWIKERGLMPATDDLIASQKGWSKAATQYATNNFRVKKKDAERIAIVNNIAKQVNESGVGLA